MSKLNLCMSLHSVGRSYPLVLRKLANVTVRLHSVTFAQSWQQGQVPKDWKKVNRSCIFRKSRKEDPGNYRPVNPWEDDGTANTGTHFQVHEGEENCQNPHGFVEGKSQNTKQRNFHNEITCLLEEWGAVNIIYLGFHKAFDTSSHRETVEGWMNRQKNEPKTDWMGGSRGSGQCCKI